MKTLLILALLISHCLASEVTVAWDANPEPDISYKIFYGISSGDHPNMVDAGQNLQVTVPNLNDGVRYYFVAVAYNPDGVQSLPSSEINHRIPLPAEHLVKYVDDEQSDGYSADLAIDGDPNTFWHTTWREGLIQKPMPHELQIDLRKEKSLIGFSLLQRQDEFEGSNVKGYELYLSLDGATWGDPVSIGELPQGKQLNTVTFSRQSARYIRFIVTSAQNGSQAASIAELSVTESPVLLPPSAPTSLRIVK